MNLPEIIAQLEACHFECEAGPLEMNVAFVELKKMAYHQEERMYKYNVLIRGCLVPIFVQADSYEVIHDALVFREKEKRKATFANGEWIGVIRDDPLPESTVTDGA